jgi:hypothetical protein
MVTMETEVNWKARSVRCGFLLGLFVLLYLASVIAFIVAY